MNSSELLVFAIAGLALVLPALLWQLYRQRPLKVIYEGPAVISTVMGASKQAQQEVYFASVILPDRKMTLIAGVPAWRFKTEWWSNAQVKVCSSFGKPFVQSITWPGESVAEKDAGLAPEALFPALAYMGIGFGALYYSAILFAQSALLGHLALYYAALLFAMSGSIMGKFFILPKLIGQGETLSVRFLGFDIGKSAAGLWAGLALSTALTGVLFWTPSIATLFIGLSVAMALGTFSAFVAERKKI